MKNNMYQDKDNILCNFDKLCHLFVVCETHVMSAVGGNPDERNLQPHAVIMTKGENKSLHLESEIFAPSAEQPDLIHTAWRNCLLGKRPKESRNITHLKWRSLTLKSNKATFLEVATNI